MNELYVSNLVLFLINKTNSVWGVWTGKMTAKEQRNLFGRFIGKGKIVINGEDETVCNRVKVCFGLDYDDRNIVHWRDL